MTIVVVYWLGCQGEDLANSSENLHPTDSHINRSKKADSMSEHLAKHSNEYTEDGKKNECVQQIQPHGVPIMPK